MGERSAGSHRSRKASSDMAEFGGSDAKWHPEGYRRATYCCSDY